MQVIEEPEAIVEAIFDFYESRGFQPTRAERERMLNLCRALRGLRLSTHAAATDGRGTAGVRSAKIEHSSSWHRMHDLRVRPAPLALAAVRARRVRAAAASRADAAAAEARAAAGDSAPPPEIASDPDLEPQVTIMRRTAKRSRRHASTARLTWIKVTPRHGRPYYPDSRRQRRHVHPCATASIPALKVPMWLLFSF